MLRDVKTTSPAERKLTALDAFIRTHLAPYAAVRGVVVTGSVARGDAREGSDIDAYVFMDPLDPYIVPAESIWDPRDDTFHSIFSDDVWLDLNGLQLDLHRVDINTWAECGTPWPEPVRAELAEGTVIHDPSGTVAELIRAHTAMSDAERQEILDEIVIQGLALVGSEDPTEGIDTLGVVEAADRVTAAYQELTRGVLALHKKWRPWRNREYRVLRTLPWLPRGLREHPLTLMIGSTEDEDHHGTRHQAVRTALLETIRHLQELEMYGDDALGEAFRRAHDEPGRAWNMDGWNDEHIRRHGRLPG
jgi:hypothetical protein